MITSISIENFKSIQSLKLELGRLNVFIGANGSGKSNILEAIAMGSAAMEDKLDDEFLVNRGIRIVEPTLMKSGFDGDKRKSPIHIVWSNGKTEWNLKIASTNGHFNSWKVSGGLNELNDYATKMIEDDEQLDLLIEETKNELKKEGKTELVPAVEGVLKGAKLGEFMPWIELKSMILTQLSQRILGESQANDFLNFIIYAPENHFLRRFEEEAAIKPLGIKGEGLFKLITIIANEYPDQFNEIKKHLKLIDWFEDFEIPGDLKFTERRIKIKDQYLADDLQYFDQRSANEGFLYLLFYLTLFVSEDTPHFFAIDNIDNSLNPKLGSELIKVLAKLAKDHQKQALLTTHNPVILDGLDLNDDEQRLFVVYRNADGHTKVRRIPARKPMNGIQPVRLSEAFIRGYIGGLPDNF